jgi:hypothetical protein
MILRLISSIGNSIISVGRKAAKAVYDIIK